MIERRRPLKRGRPPKRTELKRSTPWLQASSPFVRRSRPKASRSRRARPDEPLAVWCEAKTDACTGRAEVRHHKRGRGKPGDDDREHTLDACDSCHRWIHAHPKISYERGWMERRT